MSKTFAVIRGWRHPEKKVRGWGKNFSDEGGVDSTTNPFPQYERQVVEDLASRTSACISFSFSERKNQAAKDAVGNRKAGRGKGLIYSPVGSKDSLN